MYSHIYILYIIYMYSYNGMRDVLIMSWCHTRSEKPSGTKFHRGTRCGGSPFCRRSLDGPSRTSVVGLPSGNLLQFSIENGHRNSEFSYEKWWFSIAMLVYQRVTRNAEENMVGLERKIRSNEMDDLGVAPFSGSLQDTTACMKNATNWMELVCLFAPRYMWEKSILFGNLWFL